MTEHEDLIAEVLEAHVPREVFFGYPVEPGEVVEEGYIETCMCGEKYPCDAVRLVKALEKVTAERDELAAVVEQMKQSEHYRLTESERKRFGEGNGCVCPMCSALATAPSVALDRVRAEARRDALLAEAEALEHYEHIWAPDGGVYLGHITGLIRRDADRIEKGESNE